MVFKNRGGQLELLILLKNEDLAIDHGGYLYANSHRVSSMADCFPGKSRLCVRSNRFTRE